MRDGQILGKDVNSTRPRTTVKSVANTAFVKPVLI